MFSPLSGKANGPWIILIVFHVLGHRLVSALSSPAWTHSAIHFLGHVMSPSMDFTPLEDIVNTRIPGKDNVEVLAFLAKRSTAKTLPPSTKQPVLILIHEFFGLNPSIREKAQGLADDLGCLVVAPDTFRGTSTEFIPKAIWLALTTPQNRVNEDLDAVCNYLVTNNLMDATSKVAVMGFCY